MPTPLRQTSGGLAPAHLASRHVLLAVIAAFSVAVGFLAVWRTNVAKYAGAVTGLAIGNILKYRLDRPFTFNQGAFDRTAAQWEARSWS